MKLISASSSEKFTSGSIEIHQAGLLDFEVALDLQKQIHTEVAQGVRSHTLLLLEHPSVFTAGKRTTQDELPSDGSRVVAVDRGGKITWHGPGQLIGYPIVKLVKPAELVGFVRQLEAGLIDVCAEFGLLAERVEGRSGVWIRDAHGDRKIAAIGIRVAQGVTMHGFALNVNPDLQPFNNIIPCGIDDAGVTSMAQELTRYIDIDEVLPTVERCICTILSKVIA